MWHLVLSCLFVSFSEFLRDFTRFICEFLLKLAHMSLLKVFMQYFRFLDFYMSNDPKSELELRKLANFWADWNLVLRTVRGSGADSPPFLRIVHQRLCREVVNRRNTLRTVRQRTADSPPVLGSFDQRQFQSVGSVKNSKAHGPPDYRGQSATGQNGGVGQTWLILDVLGPSGNHSKRLDLVVCPTCLREKERDTFEGCVRFGGGCERDTHYK